MCQEWDGFTICIGATMASSVVSHPNAMLRALSRDFELKDEDDILAFIERHPTVLPLLPEIRSKIRDYFGDDPVRPEVFHDPEWEEAPPELFANIRTKLGPHEALERIHQFDRERLLNELNKPNVPVVVSAHL